ncbi:MAG: exopolysaccharide biosynthesis protein [Deltaproteobacteria bacterium]|nr:MAG: exopolysaccharide biosynthesis protein [Deltaproteobacteria bacterium]
MSKLEKAMERAKQARGIETSPAGAATIPTPVNKGRRLEPIDPVYTQTRVYPFDKALLEKHGVLTTAFNPIIVEQYNLLRARVMEAMTSNGYNSILVTSPEPEEGKTLTAVNLAISIARESNRTVLLIDTDMRQTSVHRYLGLPGGTGLYEYITKGTPLSELLINPGLPRLTVLPAGMPADYPADLLSGPAMQEFVRDVKGRYPDRYIIFDSPPILAYADGLYLARYADTVLMVARSGSTKEDNLRQALESLGDRPLLGTVLNRVPKGQGPAYSYY